MGGFCLHPHRACICWWGQGDLDQSAVLGEHYVLTGKMRWMLADDPRCRQCLLSAGRAARGDREIRPSDGGQEQTHVRSQGLLLGISLSTPMGISLSTPIGSGVG